MSEPLVHELDRARVLAALACVDAVVLFEQDTPTELIEKIRPDILVKGGDYKPEEVAGRNMQAKSGSLILKMAIRHWYSWSRYSICWRKS